MGSPAAARVPGASLAIHYAWYNFVRIHQTLRVAPRWRLASQIGFGRLGTWWSCLTPSQPSLLTGNLIVPEILYRLSEP